MTRLLDRLIKRDQGYWEGMASGASVLTTSYAGPDREPVLPQLAAYAQGANAGNSPVFAAALVRMALFSECRFQFQAKDSGRLFGNTSLVKVEQPFGPDSTTGDLLARMEQDVFLAGNAYIWDAPNEDRLVRLRPDWVTIVSERVAVDGGGWYRRPTGYWFEPPKSLTDPDEGFMVPAAEVVHWRPIPDPAADFRGMCPLTPVIRDVQGDDGMTGFKIRYMQNDATPNMVIRYAQRLQPGTIDQIRERTEARYGGPANAGKTLVLDQGADLTLAGNSLSQMDFGAVQAVGTERILAACSVPGVLVGLEPLRGAGRGYQESMQKLANIWARPQWRSVCGALSPIVDVPPGNRLWYDTADIQALQDGEMERGQAALVRMQALLAAVQAGYTHESAIAAVDSMDLSQLKAGGIGTPSSSQPVQHLLPQAQPGATASPLPATLPRLGVGSTSPGDGGTRRGRHRGRHRRGGRKGRTGMPDPGTAARGSDLKYGHGSALWKYWTTGEGFAKWSGAPHKWTTLHALLLKAGVPAHSADGLTTNIITAVMPGYMKQAHAEKHAGRADMATITERAEMTSASINDLPDSEFAYIEAGGKKDSSGKTTPRSLRHFPVHDAAHVRNALARAPQSPHGDKAMGKIKSRAKKFGVEVSDDSSSASRASMDWIRPAIPLEDIHIVRSAGGDRTGTLVEAYATVFDEPAEIHDDQGHYSEIIDRAAFDQVLTRIRASRGGFASHVKVLYNHGKTAEGTPAPEFQLPLGVPEDIRPESRGLLTRTRYDAGDPLAERVLAKIEAGSITSYSFVGGIMRSSPELRGPGDRYRARNGALTTVRRMMLGLREYGPVLWAAYTGAEILGVRMQLPGAAPEDLDFEPPADEEDTPDMEGDVTGSAPEDATTPRYHQHALYRMTSEEKRAAVGLTW